MTQNAAGIPRHDVLDLEHGDDDEAPSTPDSEVPEEAEERRTQERRTL